MSSRAARRETIRSANSKPWGVFAASILVIGAAIAFGGASRENPIRLAIVEFASLPLALWGLRNLLLHQGWKGATIPLAIFAAIVLIPLIQVTPLPSGAWTHLPGQAPRLTALELGGLAPPWEPISLYPSATLATIPALFPPGAVFLGALSLTRVQIRSLALVWIGGAAAGLALGIFQIAMPDGGPAYLYKTTNTGSVVGFFANHNHEAGFLLALMPLAACLGAGPIRASQRNRARPWRGWLVGLYFILAIVALGVIRSRAGVILTAPAALASVGLMWWTSPSRDARRLTGALAAMIVFAAAAVALFALTPILRRFSGGAGEELRFRVWPILAHAASGCLPFGAGLGAFDRVFRAVEPLSLVAPAYFNHAHNDFLEIWLETGAMGAAVFSAFLAWLLSRARVVTLSHDELGAGALLAMIILLACSTVDYPLRTETLATLFAFCAAIVARARPAGHGEERTGA